MPAEKESSLGNDQGSPVYGVAREPGDVDRLIAL